MEQAKASKSRKFNRNEIWREIERQLREEPLEPHILHEIDRRKLLAMKPLTLRIN